MASFHSESHTDGHAHSHAGCVTSAPRRAGPILPRASLGTRNKPRTPDTLANPLSPSCSVLTSVSGASLIHLRMSALPSTGRGSGCESLRQLQRISYVTRLSVYIQTYLPSCSHSAPAKTTLLLLFPFFFFHGSTLTIDHFCESCNNDSNLVCFSRPAELFRGNCRVFCLWLHARLPRSLR